MASSERSDPAWVAHEINSILVHFAEKLSIDVGRLKSEVKKLAAEWPEQATKGECPQDAYLAFAVRRAELAAVFSEAIEGILRKGGETDPRVLLVRAFTNEAVRGNDWSTLQAELWARLDEPDLPAGAADEIAAKLEVLESERVLADPPRGGLTALRPEKEGPWPVYFADASTCRKVADDLIEWLGTEVGKV